MAVGRLLVTPVTEGRAAAAATELLLVQQHNQDNQILEQVLMQDLQANRPQVAMAQVAVVPDKQAAHAARLLVVMA